MTDETPPTDDRIAEEQRSHDDESNSDADADAEPSPASGDDPIHVDLTGGETQPEGGVDAGATPPEQNGQASGAAGSAADQQQQQQQPEQELYERARETAQQHLRNASGATESEAVDEAFEELRGKFESLREQFQQADQHYQQLQARHEQFDSTRDHLEEIADAEDDDRLILREWAAGITTAVPHDELPDVIEKIEDRMEQQREQLDQLSDQHERLEEATEVAKLALQQLGQTRETLSGIETERDPLRAASDQPGGGQGGRQAGGQPSRRGQQRGGGQPQGRGQQRGGQDAGWEVDDESLL